MKPKPLLADPDSLEQASRDAFDRTHPGARFGPIAVILPAYREAQSIGEVLRQIPREIAGRAVSVLVIVDGPEDGTTALAAAAGAFVAATAGHRGQGAALRLGYRIAAAHGSDYLVTLDADGQYLPSEIAAIVGPLLTGEADFVSGSRRLGGHHTTDPVRSLGVDVFATLIRLLTGHAVTDPAFGLRALTADVARTVSLRQPQYQAAELLVGAIARGFRVAERPATMHLRAADKSRKGGNLLYGYRFGRVVLGTWWREHRVAQRGSAPGERVTADPP